MGRLRPKVSAYPTESQSLEVLMDRLLRSELTHKPLPTSIRKHLSRLRWLNGLLRTGMPALFFLTVSAVAHAQGTMDFSGATTLMTTFKTFAMYAGAVICLGGLIFAGIRMMSGRFQDAIPGLFGALFGAGVLEIGRAHV